MRGRGVVLANLVCLIQLAGLQITRASASTECQADEIYCTNNDLIVECLPAGRVCDGVNDCYDGEDEYNCGCPSPFEEVSSNTGWCVQINVVEATWQEARDACRSLDADLAVINDWDFYGDLIDYIHMHERFRNYWVGASDEAEEGVWTWVDGTPVRMGTPLWGLYYASGHQEPYADSGRQDCGYLYADQYYYMADADCTKRFTSFCQKRKSPNQGTKILMKDASINVTTITPTKATKTCTAPFEVVGQRCVMLAMENLRWRDALYFCRGLGADLASISDISFHADLVDYFKVKGVTGLDFWVGANDTAKEGDWRWLDGRTVRMGTPLWRTIYDYSSGWHQEPWSYVARDDCAILDHEAFHYMNDRDCTQNWPAVCQVP